MSKLKKYKLSDLYEMSSGISTKKEQAGHGAPFVSFGTIYNNYFLPHELNEKMNTSETEQEKYSIKKGDIFLTRTSETIDELAMSSVALKNYPNATYSGFTKRLRPLQSNITYDKYMGFYLRSVFFRKTMTNNAVLTTRASFNEEIFSYLYLYLPDFEIQVKNGNLLYLLNEKIELNNKINSELEAMAKTLYDYWFVQFDFPNEEGKPYKSSGGAMEWNEELKREIPVGWEVEELGKIAEIYQPKTISEKEMEKDGKYYVFGANGVVGKYNNYNHENSEIVVTCRGNTCGNITRTYPFSWITGNAMVIQLKLKNVNNEFIFQLLRNINIHKVITGSAQPQITRANLSPVKVVIPPKELLNEFSSQVSSNVGKRLKIVEENQELASLRDWLLPMLMNGQVSVE